MTKHFQQGSEKQTKAMSPAPQRTPASRKLQQQSWYVVHGGPRHPRKFGLHRFGKLNLRPDALGAGRVLETWIAQSLSQAFSG